MPLSILLAHGFGIEKPCGGKGFEQIEIYPHSHKSASNTNI
jgi:hypothetical protein